MRPARRWATLLSASAVTGALCLLPAAGAGAATPSSASGSATARVHTPIMMFNVRNTANISGYSTYVGPSIQPPPVVACLPAFPPATSSSTCVPPPPPAGQPWPVNMAYFGGHVQLAPRVYIVYWGWGGKGAFSSACHAPGTDPVPCDPAGAGKRMLDFVKQMGGTTWAGVSTQYYQANASGARSYVRNPRNQLGGVWYDNSSHLTWDPKATGSALQNQVFAALGKEASKAAAHFRLTKSQLLNSDIVVAQPQNWSDPVAASLGYCAWHDYTQPNIESGIYNADTYGISFTNMPYVLNQGAGCGQNAVNSGSAGTLDGTTIVLGHELEETVTDPGAEDPGPNGTSLGAWYDATQYEIGDKCAWVGDNLTGIGPEPLPGVPGEMGTMRGNAGEVFPVQSLWSNEAAAGVGYCAGAGTDLPATGATPG